MIVDSESGVAVVGSRNGGGGRDGRTLNGYIGGHTHQGWRLCILDGNGLGSGGWLPQLSVTVQVLTMVPQPSVTELDVS